MLKWDYLTCFPNYWHNINTQKAIPVKIPANNLLSVNAQNIPPKKRKKDNILTFISTSFTLKANHPLPGKVSLINNSQNNMIMKKDGTIMSIISKCI